MLMICIHLPVLRRDATGFWAERMNGEDPGQPAGGKLRAGLRFVRLGCAGSLPRLGSPSFPPGLLLKAGQTQPLFIGTLSTEPDRRVFPEMPVWKKKPGTI